MLSYVFLTQCAVINLNLNPHGRDCNFLGVGLGVRLCKIKNFTEMYETYLEFPEVWRVIEKKSLLWGRYLNLHL